MNREVRKKVKRKKQSKKKKEKKKTVIVVISVFFISREESKSENVWTLLSTPKVGTQNNLSLRQTRKRPKNDNLLV